MRLLTNISKFLILKYWIKNRNLVPHVISCSPQNRKISVGDNNKSLTLRSFKSEQRKKDNFLIGKCPNSRINKEKWWDIDKVELIYRDNLKEVSDFRKYLIIGWNIHCKLRKHMRLKPQGNYSRNKKEKGF